MLIARRSQLLFDASSVPSIESWSFLHYPVPAFCLFYLHARCKKWSLAALHHADGFAAIAGSLVAIHSILDPVWKLKNRH